MVDLRFPTALQLMLSLALANSQGVQTVTSAKLAKGVAANPSLVRKLLVPLVRSGLVVSVMGKKGGVRLGRAAAEITLGDIYHAVVGGKQLWPLRRDSPHSCLVSTNMVQFFESVAAEADSAVRAVLGNLTLEQSLGQLRQLAHQKARSVRGTRLQGRARSRA